MSLRLRLFLLCGGLVALLVLAQWWWVRLLTRELSLELDQVAFSVGSAVVAFFRNSESAPGQRKMIECLGEEGGEDCEELGLGDRVDIVRHEQEGGRGATATGEVLIRTIRRLGPDGSEQQTPANEAPEAAPPARAPPADPPMKRFQYSWEVEDRTITEGAPAAGGVRHVEKHVQIHVEHEADAKYLWLGGPAGEHRVQIPQQGFQDKLERFSGRLMLGSMGLLALGLVLAGTVAHRVTAPLRRLSAAARSIGDGALGTLVADPGDGEVGRAIEAFNRMSKRLEELEERARDLEARKHLGEIGEIARGLAHTLRNPLNALGLSVDELAAPTTAEPGTDKSNVDEEAPRLAESARRQIRRIDQSIRSFLALASQSGSVPSEVAVGELIEDVALEALQDGRGKARLELEVGEGLPRLSAVEPELRAVLQALVVNAIEASPQGGQVTVRASALPGRRLRLEIDDHGPGLTPEVRERLFTPHLTTKANGSGMGLFLAHRIATNRYDGALELLDREGGGTRAVLELGERAASPEVRVAGEIGSSLETRGE